MPTVNDGQVVLEIYTVTAGLTREFIMAQQVVGKEPIRQGKK